MYKWQVVFCPNQIVHDLVVIINHHLFSDVGGVPTHLSGGTSSQRNNTDRKKRFAFRKQSETPRGMWQRHVHQGGWPPKWYRNSHPRTLAMSCQAVVLTRWAPAVKKNIGHLHRR